MAEFLVPEKYRSLFFPPNAFNNNRLHADDTCLAQLQTQARGETSASELLANVYRTLMATVDPQSSAGTSPRIDYNQIGDNGEDKSMLVLAALMGKNSSEPKPSLLQLTALASEMATENPEANNVGTDLVVQFIIKATDLPIKQISDTPPPSATGLDHYD